MCFNHALSNEVLLQNFYRSLDEVNKEIVNNLDGGSFMNLTFALSSIALEQMAKTKCLGIQGTMKDL